MTAWLFFRSVFGSRIPNSSPPSLASMSISLTLREINCAVVRRSSSPWSCPRVSFTVLKLSISMNTKVKGSTNRVDRLISLSANSAKYPLLDTPVRDAGDQDKYGQPDEHVPIGEERKTDFGSRDEVHVPDDRDEKTKGNGPAEMNNPVCHCSSGSNVFRGQRIVNCT